jgi:hypothetical protein
MIFLVDIKIAGKIDFCPNCKPHNFYIDFYLISKSINDSSKLSLKKKIQILTEISLCIALILSIIYLLYTYF